MEIRKKFCSELMECLTPSISFKIFMDDYFISFRLPTHNGVNSIRATRVFKQVTQMHYHCRKTAVKKERGYFEQRT